MITIKDKLLLCVQKSLSFLFFPFLFLGVWCWMRCLRGYRIHDIQTLRKRYRQIQKKHPGPLLLCPNHLTFVDSLILVWALCPSWRYYLHFKTIPWNLPKQTHVANNVLYQFICYLGKCICIPKDKDESKRVMQKARFLMQQGEDFMIFPEGTRSQTGRINTTNYIYGIGQLILDVPTVTVVSIYLRGRQQVKEAVFPKKGDTFDITCEVIHPKTTQKGRRAMRDIASQLIEQLVVMEQRYFS